MYKEAKFLSRHYLANPYCHKPLSQRLKKNNSIDLRENFEIVNLDNGYSMIKPINTTKRFK